MSVCLTMARSSGHAVSDTKRYAYKFSHDILLGGLVRSSSWALHHKTVLCANVAAQVDHWYPWMVDGQVGGYATTYDTPHNFTWATVRGAGHMAPLYQPLRVFNLFNKFLHGKKP